MMSPSEQETDETDATREKSKGDGQGAEKTSYDWRHLDEPIMDGKGANRDENGATRLKDTLAQ